ncbi:hypothetical protein IC232_13870 [Microvirga sp. BT688]|uniref:hypothetical protein n=1 Tax=Microvirga sp. TaxID=1873136 RepID=UPI001681EFCB|nr:hypothetical protein [Microvirga sp.]MBD2747787.1 hypothetical protein [Microvirga sp.]
MDETYTATALAAKLDDLGLGRDADTIRIVRHFTEEGLLQTIGAVNTGKGKKRLYARESLLKAIILLQLNHLGLPIGSIKRLVRGLGETTAAELQTDLVGAVTHTLRHPCLVLPIPGGEGCEQPRLVEVQQAYRRGDQNVLVLDLKPYRAQI